MKKLWGFIAAYLAIGAFAEIEGKKSLTAEQKTTLEKDFSPELVAQLEASFAKNEDVDLNLPSNTTAILAMQEKLRISEEANTALQADKTALASDKLKSMEKFASMEKTIAILSAQSENDPPVVKTGKESKWNPSDEKQLGGVAQPFMAIDSAHPYNKRAYAALAAQMGIEIPTPRASSMDYSQLKTDLGDYYRVRKQDRIQSFLQGLPSLDGIFPLESGYQDQAVLVNLFMLDDFSQADNTIGSSFDSVLKGSFKFEGEKITMFDVMFAHKFTDLKTLEKNWLGYLNKEGSSTMKWSLIEFTLAETAKKLQNEANLRAVNGERINPVVNVPGTSAGASDGFRVFIKKQIALFKIRPFVLGEWTPTTISEYVRLGTSMVPQVIRDRGDLELNMSSDAHTAYIKNNESLYGLNQDYKAVDKFVKEYPNVAIVVVPNMNESKRMVWTIKGNLKRFEDQPGEMMAFSLEQQDWSLKVWSNWKESLWAFMVGKKFASLAEIPQDYSTQLIFCNDVDFPADFYLNAAADDTTPSVAKHSSLVSVANTVATAITDIDDAVVGKEIRLKSGSIVNAITIAVAGKFSLLTAPWTPGLNDVIILKKRSDGKFIELSRVDPLVVLTAFAADDTSPSVAGSTEFVTNANTVPTAITTLDDAITGRVYLIHGTGAGANATTIAAAGNFLLTAAMTLSIGKWIRLQKSATDNKFYEIDRG